jgi:hypothetical protein
MVFGIYKVQGITNEELVANVIHVEMQHHHLYIVCHATMVVNVVATYRAKHNIVNSDMV